MKNLRSFATIALGAVALQAHADSPHTFTSNVSIVSDYYFRGLTQTFHQPAIQGGMDYANASGFYAGVWGSNVSADSYSRATAEFDLYGGYNGKISDDLSWTAGVYSYMYPGAEIIVAAGTESYTTVELNAGLTYKWLSAKLSYAATDLFAINKNTGYSDDSKGSYYLDINAALPVNDTVTASLHVGYQGIPSDLTGAVAGGGVAGDSLSYYDYKAGVTMAPGGGWSLGLAVVGASNSKVYDKATGLVSAKVKDLGSTTLVATVARSF